MSIPGEDPMQAESAPEGRGSRRDRTSLAETTEFAEHLATLTATGLPLGSGFRALSREVTSTRLRGVLVETADRLELGQPLDSVLQSLANRFPVCLRGLILAGSASGRLTEVLGQFVRYTNLGAMLRRRFALSAVYPVFLFVFVLLIYFFICYWLISSFEAIFNDFGIALPHLTIALLKLAALTREHAPTIAAELTALVLLTSVCARLFLNPAERRRLKTALPIVGPILRWSILAEYCHLIGLLVASSLPLPESLVLAAEGVGDPELIEAGTKLRTSVEQGRGFSESLADWPRCPAGLRQILDGAEGRGDLAPSLHLAGDMFEARARAEGDFATVGFAAVTLILLLLFVGVVIIAMFLPLINLISRLSG